MIVCGYMWEIWCLSHSLQVISCLLAQTSRQELLSMLYEVELRRHRDTHRLLSAASSQLHSWREQTSKRNVSPFHCTHYTHVDMLI